MTIIDDFRYSYDFNASSVVIDCGFYKGDFAKVMIGKFGCRVIAFEPCPEYYMEGLLQFDGENRLQLYNYAIGASRRTEIFNRQNDSTGLYATTTDSFQVNVEPLLEVLDHLSLPVVDLLKLNIEGMEYEVLEDILLRRATERFRHIQVQFHSKSNNADKRYALIRQQLLEHYKSDNDSTWLWEFYSL